ncbi:hypothetical protein ANCDUO_13337 [Ancylostoma duodenale]|uniref:Uncharacterized protein n=1 Tax=Ancylostoma duodenale TaxID=51022 RepID=A0A0C2D361_9BILA|nr:hypothetical protein ANCDUO_13337 [Ancylostoma duodenale]
MFSVLLLVYFIESVAFYPFLVFAFIELLTLLVSVLHARRPSLGYTICGFQNKMQNLQFFTCRTFPLFLVSHLEGGIQHVPVSGGDGGECRFPGSTESQIYKMELVIRAVTLLKSTSFYMEVHS